MMKTNLIRTFFLLLTLTVATGKLSQAKVLNNSLVIEKWIAQLRDENTKPKEFREALEKIGEKLAEEAMKYLVPATVQVTNPMKENADHILLAERPVLFAILRAGMPLAHGMQAIFSESSMGFIGSARDEKTAIAQSTYVTVPAHVYGRVVIIADTMLATGGSMEDAIRIILKYSPRHVIAVCAIAAPEGVERLQKAFGPRLTVLAAATDSHLNKRGYIIPGLGDAGDRAYGPKL